jgi:hypothetical protein
METERPMKGKWAAGIAPRNFTWIIRDSFAISERPGGFGATHRRVRRQEELIWLRVQGFTRIFSIMSSPHNLAAYEEHHLPYAHHPIGSGSEARESLEAMYEDLNQCLESGMRVLLHQEELGDRVMGVVAGYLIWSGRLNSQHQAISLMEHLIGHPMGSAGREIVVVAASIEPHKAQ